MISKRLLQIWRKEALLYKNTENPALVNGVLYVLQERILRLTQELLDLHLIRGKS